MSDRRPKLETQQPALVPATGTHIETQEEGTHPVQSGDRDLDTNGVEQDDDGQPGTGLGPDPGASEKE